MPELPAWKHFSCWFGRNSYQERQDSQQQLIVDVKNLGLQLSLILNEEEEKTVSDIQRKLDELECYPCSTIQLLDTHGLPVNDKTLLRRMRTTGWIPAKIRVSSPKDLIEQRDLALDELARLSIPGMVCCEFRSMTPGVAQSLVVELNTLDFKGEAEARFDKMKFMGFPVRVIKHEPSQIVLL